MSHQVFPYNTSHCPWPPVAHSQKDAPVSSMASAGWGGTPEWGRSETEKIEKEQETAQQALPLPALTI